METFDTLIEHCRSISHILGSTSRSRQQGDTHDPAEINASDFDSPNGLGGSRRFEISEINHTFHDFFYEEHGFASTFANYTHFLSNHTALAASTKNRLCCVVIAGCILNFRTTHIAFDVCPDLSLSLTLELFERFEDHDEFVLERLLLAKRLKNDVRLSRKCSRLLRRCLFNTDLHRYINKLIDTTTDSYRNPLQISKLKYRLSILANLSDVLNFCNFPSLKSCASFLDEFVPAPDAENVNPRLTHDKSGDSPYDTRLLLDIRVTLDKILNRQPLKLPVPLFHIFVRLGNCIIDYILTPNLVQIASHVSYKRGNACCYNRTNSLPSSENSSFNNAALVESESGPKTSVVHGENFRSNTHDAVSCIQSHRPDKNAEENYKQMQLRQFGYVVLENSEELLSKMLFWVDTSIGLVITGSGCSNFYVKLLAKKLWVDPLNISNVYTDESADSKSLVGSWVSSGSSGEFVYNYGVLSRAMDEGRWLIFDSQMSDSTLAFLLTICETGELYINELNKTIKAHENFQVFIILSPNAGQNCNNKSIIGNITSEYSVPILNIPELTKSDIIKICTSLFHSRYTDWLVSVVFAFFEDSGHSLTISHIIKYLKRVSFYLSVPRFKGQHLYHGNQDTSTVDVNLINTNLRMLMLYDFYVTFVSKTGDPDSRVQMISRFAQFTKLHVDSIDTVFSSFSLLKYFVTAESGFSPQAISLFNSINNYTGYNEHVMRMLYTCQLHNEPVLLVGETGTGKTELVQKIASLTGNTLKVYIFNENTDTNELIGTYKPCSSTDTQNNEKPAENRIAFKFYEGVLVECMKNGYWLLLDEINLAPHDILNKLYSAISIAYDKDNSGERYIELYECVNHRVQIHHNFRLFACMNPHVVAKKGGLTINSGKKELPLSFYKLFTAIYVDPIRRFDDLLRVGLKHLGDCPVNIKPLIDFYLGLLDLADGCSITDGSFKTPHLSLRNFVRAVKYIKNASERSGKEITANKIMYDAVCANFLSTLDPDSFDKAEALLQDEIRRYRFDITKVVNTGSASVDYLEFIKPDNNVTDVFGYKIRRGDADKRHDSSNVHDNKEEFVLCTDNVGYLVKLARIVSGIESPILLEGPTGVGKTSIVKFLCHITNHICVRINNHEGIDVSDYVGQYTFTDNRLVFEYGTLVVAMKHGYWVILDELNLASSEILECLNSVLDENRRIFIPETNETIECHPEFRIFATQNPSDSVYGGRKQLSTAFKNRFIQIYFDEISDADLSVILQRRCQIPLSRSTPIISSYSALKSLTLNSMLFQKNEILVTVRDLIKLCNRMNSDSHHFSEVFKSEVKLTLRQEYSLTLLVGFYSLVAEKLYIYEEKAAVFECLKGSLMCPATTPNSTGDASLKKRKLSIDGTNTESFDSNKGANVTMVPGVSMPFVDRCYSKLLPYVVDMPRLKSLFEDNGYFWIDGYTDRLLYLVVSALRQRENVLLVGDTGIGKTTVFQLLSLYHSVKLNIFNSHQNTDTVDFLGCVKPVYSNDTDAKCNMNFEFVNGPLINSMINGDWFLFDEISLIEDSILEKINSILEFSSYIIDSSFSANNPSSENIKYIYSHPEFRLLGTMNPGNDFGKKELSPSIANRFTKIFVPPIDLTDYKILNNIASRVRSSLGYSSGANTVPSSDDWLVYSLIDIVKHISKAPGFGPNASTISPTSQGSGITLRNVITLFEYHYSALKSALSDGTKDATKTDFQIKSFVDSLYVSILNSYSVKPISESETYNIIFKNVDLYCRNMPCWTNAVDYRPKPLDNNSYDNILPILQFCLKNVPMVNILLEGNPGVGKTFHAIELAKMFNKRLVRINLNEFTDLTDLVGNYVFGDSGLTDTESKGVFRFRYGPLLDAVVSGDWVVLDELNLASSEVLEGINSLLDHRRDIFVPELNKCFKSHPEFRIFATQNSSLSLYRKGLPKSLLNRFVRVHVYDMVHQDYSNILEKSDLSVCRDILLDTDKSADIGKMIAFVMDLNTSINTDRKYNVRDLIVLKTLMAHHGIMLAVNAAVLNSIVACVGYFAQGLAKMVSDSFVRFFGFDLLNSYPKLLSGPCPLGNDFGLPDYPDIYNSLSILHKLNVPILFIYSNNREFATVNRILDNYHRLICLENRNSLTSRSPNLEKVQFFSSDDVADLLGSYEYTNNDLVFNKIKSMFKSLLSMVDIKTLWKDLESDLNCLNNKLTSNDRNHAELEQISSFVGALLTRLNDQNHQSLCSTYSSIKQSAATILSLVEHYRLNERNKKFGISWVDSKIVKCVQDGDFLLVNRAHLVNSSIIDRLNPLLEFDRSLSVNECGFDRTIAIHDDFRIFFSAHATHLDKLSYSFFNRCVKVDLRAYKLVNSPKSCLINRLLSSFQMDLSQQFDLKTTLSGVYVYEVYDVINTIDVLLRQDPKHSGTNILSLFSLDHLIILSIVFALLAKVIESNDILIRTFVYKYLSCKISSVSSQGGFVQLFCDVLELVYCHESLSTNQLVDGPQIARLSKSLVHHFYDIKVARPEYRLLSEYMSHFDDHANKSGAIGTQSVQNDCVLTALYSKHLGLNKFSVVWYLQKGALLDDRVTYFNIILDSTIVHDKDLFKRIYGLYHSLDLSDIHSLVLLTTAVGFDRTRQQDEHSDMLVLDREYIMDLLETVVKRSVSDQSLDFVWRLSFLFEMITNNTGKNDKLHAYFVLYRNLTNQGLDLSILPADLVDRFAVLDGYTQADVRFSFDNLRGIGLLTSDAVLSDTHDDRLMDLYIDQLIVSKVTFLVCCALHSYLTNSPVPESIVCSFDELIGRITKFYTSVQPLLLDVLNLLYESLKTLAAVSTQIRSELIGGILSNLSTLHIYSRKQNYCDSEDGFSELDFISQLLFDGRSTQSTKTTGNADGNILIRILSSFSTLRLIDNLKKLRLVEFLITIHSADNTLSLVFANIAFFSGFFDKNIAKANSSCFAGFVKSTYAFLVGGTHWRESLSEVDDGLRAVSEHFDSGKLNDDWNVLLSAFKQLRDVCLKFKSCLNFDIWGPLVDVTFKLTKSFLGLIPNVQTVVKGVDDAAARSFLNYKAFELSNMYTTFNILDSLSVGYSINNKHILGLIKKCMEEVHSKGVDIEHLENHLLGSASTTDPIFDPGAYGFCSDSKLSLVLEFIAEYTSFIGRYCSNFDALSGYLQKDPSHASLSSSASAILNFVCHINAKYTNISDIIAYPAHLLISVVFVSSLKPAKKNGGTSIAHKIDSHITNSLASFLRNNPSYFKTSLVADLVYKSGLENHLISDPNKSQQVPDSSSRTLLLLALEIVHRNRNQSPKTDVVFKLNTIQKAILALSCDELDDDSLEHDINSNGCDDSSGDSIFSKGILTESLFVHPSPSADLYILATYYLTLVSGSRVHSTYEQVVDSVIFDTFLKHRQLSALYRFCSKDGFRFPPVCIDSSPKPVDFGVFQNIKSDGVEAIESSNLLNVFNLLIGLRDYCSSVIQNTPQLDPTRGESSEFEKTLLVSKIDTTVKNILSNFPKETDVSLFTLLKTKLTTLYNVLDFYGNVGSVDGNQAHEHKVTIGKYLNAVQQIVDYFKLSYLSRLRVYNYDILRDYKIQNLNHSFNFVLRTISNFLFNFVLKQQNNLDNEHILNELNLIKNSIIGFLFDTSFLNTLLLGVVFDQIKRIISSSDFLHRYSPCFLNRFCSESRAPFQKLAVVKLVELFDYILNLIFPFVKTANDFLSDLDKNYNKEFSINYSDLLDSCRKNTLTSYFERPGNFTIFNKIVETYMTSLNTKFSVLHQQTLFNHNIMSENVLLNSLETSDNTSNSQIIQTVANSLNHLIDNHQSIKTPEIRRILLSIVDSSTDIELNEPNYEDSGFSVFVAQVDDILLKSVKRTDPDYLLYYFGFVTYIKARLLYFSNFFESFERVLANYFAILHYVHNITFIKRSATSLNDNSEFSKFNTLLFEKIVDDKVLKFLNANVHALFVLILHNFWEFSKSNDKWLLYGNSNAGLKLESTGVVHFEVQQFCQLFRLLSHLDVLVHHYTSAIKNPDELLASGLEKLVSANYRLRSFVSHTREYSRFCSLQSNADVVDSLQTISINSGFLSNVCSCLKEMRDVLVELPTNSLSLTINTTLDSVNDLLGGDSQNECTELANPLLFSIDSCPSIKQELLRLHEVSVFYLYFSKLLYAILLIPDSTKDEVEQDGPGQISAGLGLDEGTGLKNVSDQLDQEDLNLENQPKQSPEQLDPESEGQGIDLDIDFEGEDISPEELEDHEEPESEQNPSKMPETDQEPETLPSELLEDDDVEHSIHESGEMTQQDRKEVDGPDEYAITEPDSAAGDVSETKEDELTGLTTEVQEYGHEAADSREQIESTDDNAQTDAYENEAKRHVDEETEGTGADRQDSVDYLNLIDELKSFNVGSSYPQHDQESRLNESETAEPDPSTLDSEMTNDSLESSLKHFINSYNIIKQSSFNRQSKRSKLFEYYENEHNNELDEDVKAQIAGDVSNRDHEPTASDDDVIMADDDGAERGENDVSMEERDADASPDDVKRFDNKLKPHPKHIETPNPEAVDNAVLALNNTLLADYRNARSEPDRLEDWPKSEEAGAEEFSGDVLTNAQLMSLSNALYTQLNIILQPNSSARYVGYFKRGKKLSVKKLLIFLATNYQRNKIWLRKIKPNKKNYLVEVAIDNTKSMANIRAIAVQSLLVIFNAIHKMNIGTFEVIKYGIYQPDVILSKSQPDLRALLTKLTFEEENKFSYELGLVSLMDYVMASTAKPRGTRNRILIIITDGKFNKARVRSHVISLINAGVLPLLIILDPNNAVLKMKQITNQDGRIKIESYLSNFPFPYYSIITNITQLPSILSDLLKQWINICSRG